MKKSLSSVSVSVVIPAFNEEQRISNTLRRIVEYLGLKFRDFEIIVVDDSSSDRTASAVQSVASRTGNIKLLKNPANAGKGYSIKRGVLASQGSVILITDADLSTPIEEIEKLFLWLEKGFDVAIGSRGMSESLVVVKQPF